MSVPCRQCGEPIDPRLALCPHCDAPRPGQAQWHGEGFEWRSRAQWMGAPVVHIAFGNGADGRPRVAGGLIAIGQRARGGVAIGIIATGFVAIGVVGLGIFSIGVVAIGAVAAAGVNALAPVAVGVVAAGYTVGAVAPFGWKILFSVKG
jgi:hypothetical protein